MKAHVQFVRMDILSLMDNALLVNMVVTNVHLQEMFVLAVSVVSTYKMEDVCKI